MMCKRFNGEVKMLKQTRSLAIGLVFLLGVILGSCSLPRVYATPATLLVPTQYPTIQVAVNAANPGDTIQVAAGVYNEYVFVNKSVSLLGVNPLTTIIDGSGTGNNTVLIASNTNNVRIEGFTIQKGENPFGSASLSIGRSNGHTIKNNIISKSSYGLRLASCNDSYISNNVIANNTEYGIYFSSSSRNSIMENLFEENLVGVRIADVASKDNTFYRNNFVDNGNQVQVFGSAKWDNGAEGNYWSDYHGVDQNGDGIGDTGVPHLSVDRYPLMEKWSEVRQFSSLWKGVTYRTVVHCNSTVASFNFTYPLAQVSFNTTGPRYALSIYNITVEKAFLDGIFTVRVDGVSKTYASSQNSTHRTIYFTFTNSVHKIQIRGTIVVGNTIPNANFSYSPTEPMEGQNVQFADSSSDLDGAVTGWLWSFGDGNTSSQKNPVHWYAKKGTYTVTLSVTDNGGATNTMAKIIAVETAPSPDYTPYYLSAGIIIVALIPGIMIFLLKKRKNLFHHQRCQSSHSENQKIFFGAFSLLS